MHGHPLRRTATPPASPRNHQANWATKLEAAEHPGQSPKALETSIAHAPAGGSFGGSSHGIAKLLLEHAGTFLERGEAVRAAMELGMPLNEIEHYLDWLDMMRGPAVPLK
jgi:hypothetical protein